MDRFFTAMLPLLLLFQGASSRPLTNNTNDVSRSFVRANGLHFVAGDGNPVYLNGFNAYWMMYMGSDPFSRDKVSSVLSHASKNGLNMVRTWAFNDGNRYRALQTSPGSYDEQVFKVVASFQKHACACMHYIYIYIYIL